jgi:hypothetical protein
MGISSKTAQRIQEAITAEAATMHDAKGAKAVVSIKENEEKMKQLRVRDTGARGWWWWSVNAGGMEHRGYRAKGFMGHTRGLWGIAEWNELPS